MGINVLWSKGMKGVIVEKCLKGGKAGLLLKKKTTTRKGEKYIFIKSGILRIICRTVSLRVVNVLTECNGVT